MDGTTRPKRELILVLVTNQPAKITKCISSIQFHTRRVTVDAGICTAVPYPEYAGH